MQNEGEARKSGVRYESLLLRIWRRSGPEAPGWSFRIEHIQEGTALRFSEPEALIAYLRAVIGAQEASLGAHGAAQVGPSLAHEPREADVTDADGDT